MARVTAARGPRDASAWARGALLGAAALVSFGASAHTHDLFDCARYLLSHREHHTVPSVSAAHTRAALAELRTFRARHLGGFDFVPGGRVVTATDGSSAARRAALARRLTGVLEEASPTIDVDETGARRQITRATAVRGTEDVDAFITSIARAGDPRGGGASGLDHENFWRLQAMPAGALCLCLLPASDYLTHASTPSMFVTGVILVLNRVIPEAACRGLSGFAWTKPLEDRVRAQLASLEPGGWFAKSANLLVPTEIVNRMWLAGTTFDGDVVEYGRWRGNPRWTLRFTGHHLHSAKIRPRPFGSTSWVRMDLVLARDQRGEPSLIFVSRQTETLPSYPKPARAASEIDGLAGSSLEQPL